MPSPHTHADRGSLHPDCQACVFLANLMLDAGVEVNVPTAPAFPRVSHVGVPRLHAHTSGTPTFDFTNFITGSTVDDRPDLSVAGEEMGNKAKVTDDWARAAEHDWLGALIKLSTLKHLGYGNLTLNAHVYLDHEGQLPPLGLTLKELQEVHASLHHQGVGHQDSPAHLVGRFSLSTMESRYRLITQARQHDRSKAAKAKRHQDRTEAARAQRKQVLIDSARNLKRAIEHAKGTVMPRATFTAADAHVSIRVGYRDRVTVAVATSDDFIALGTAVCHPTDTFDREVGAHLSIARALVALGATIEDEWTTKVEERS